MAATEEALQEVDDLTPGSPPVSRRGRRLAAKPKAPAKTRKRHDPVPAPVDGDYQPLDLVGKEPGYEYFALSDRDRQRRGHQYEVVRWSAKCAHSPWDVFKEEMAGQEVKINGQLTLVRCPKNQIEARRKRERDAFRAASAGIRNANTERGFGVNENFVNTHNIPVAGAY